MTSSFIFSCIEAKVGSTALVFSTWVDKKKSNNDVETVLVLKARVSGSIVVAVWVGKVVVSIGVVDSGRVSVKTVVISPDSVVNGLKVVGSKTNSADSTFLLCLKFPFFEYFLQVLGFESQEQLRNICYQKLIWLM